MGADSIGHIFKFHSFGESHGPAIGAVIEGCPSGLSISLELLKRELNRRRPGDKPWTSSRRELDKPIILSGIFKGKSLGTPIAVLILNQDARSQDYDSIEKNPRPGHSEDLWKIKFSHFDHRGGGRASGRETAGRVIAGSFARMLTSRLCPSFKLIAFVRQIGPLQIQPKELIEAEELFKSSNPCADSFPARFPHREKSLELEDLLKRAKEEGESLGSLLELWMEGLPPGLGRPLFHKLKSDLAQGMMSLGASAGVEFGLGFLSAGLKGSVFHSKAENYGGLRGGLSTGERLCLRLVFKPPSSMGQLAKEGRHDPCIGPRAVPVVEAQAYLTVADHLLYRRLDRLHPDR